MNDEEKESKPSEPIVSPRRCFLRLVGAGSVLGALGGCSADAGSPQEFGDVAAGNASALAVGSLQPVAGAPAIVGRDAMGLYAMTSTCTHEGCDMIQDGSVSSAGIVCRCHGSVFDALGNRVSGPAEKPLTHFAVTVDASGAITIHGGTTVAASARTPVTG